MTAQTYEFQTETARLLDIMIHSLYSNRDVFLRELISNASDALDKRRFEAQTNPDLGADAESQIRIEVDKDARTLSISDNGIGMSRDEVVANIGTIARSGTKEFAELLKHKEDLAQHPELIGQFGVGFYSSFLVADSVTLVTRKAGEDTATSWESTGEGSYKISDATRDEAGTTITLHLKPADKDEGMSDYADRWVIESLVRKYSDFVSYPIRMKKESFATEDAETKESEEETTLNSQKAIWTRPPQDVTEEEYNEFYKHISHDWTEPMERVVTSIEGTFEARALLFIPQRAPFDLYHRDMTKRGIQLYVKRVFIMDDCEDLLPSYLRFIKGVVDCEDLPLNVSREVLQQNRQVTVIRKHLVKKLVSAISDIRKNDWDKYLTLWSEFGPALKEGLLMGPERNENLLDLVVAESTVTNKPRALADSVAAMSEDQKEIYYLTGTSMETLRQSPHLEAFKDKGIEVFLFTDAVDEIWLQQNLTYEGKKFVSAAKGELNLEGSADTDSEDSDKEQARSGELADLLMKMRSSLQDIIKEVRLSKRLTSSAACLVTDEGDLTPQMEQIMRASGQSVPKTKRILEVNGEHPVVQALEAIYKANPTDPRIESYTKLLHGQALLAEGGRLVDPSEFSSLVTELMVTAAQ